MLHSDHTARRSDRVPFGRITAPWQALLIIMVSIAMALLWWFPLRAMAMAQDAQHFEAIAAPAQHFIDHPIRFLLLPIPAVLASALVFVMKRGKVLMVCVAWMLELIPMAVLLYIFVSFLAPLYTYQDL